jgi:transcriptional regulator with XRE-family HTH domain
MVSDQFKEAVKLYKGRQYEIAHKAGIHPSVLSRIVCGIDKTEPGDLRVLRVAKVLGLRKKDCF